MRILNNQKNTTDDSLDNLNDLPKRINDLKKIIKTEKVLYLEVKNN